MSQYAVGTPGQSPRFICQTSDYRDIEINLRDGEVAVEQADIPPWPHRISDDGDAVEVCEMPFDIARWEKTKATNEHQGAASSSGLSLSGGVAQTDGASRDAITQQAQAAMMAKVMGQSWSIRWRILDNTYADLDADAMIDLSVRVSALWSDCKLAGDVIREAINSATTVEQLDAIDITAGYPE